MVMTAYIDESGTHGDGSPAVILACFIAGTEKWSIYETGLAQLLDANGVSVFHARKFRSRQAGFHGWSKEEQAEFNAKFLRLVDENTDAGYFVSLDSNLFNKVYRSVKAAPTKHNQDSQYGLFFRVCLWKTIILMMDRKSDWPIHFVLEGGHKNAGDALRIFDEFRNNLASQYQCILGSISFASKDECIPLAAADSLAYNAFRTTTGVARHFLPNVITAGPSDPPYIVRKSKVTRIVVSKETLRSLRSDII